jgi:hypothetical protein
MPDPKDPKKVDINVILNSETLGDFSIEPSPPNSLPTGPNGELIFKNDGHPGIDIHFKLLDRTGLGYRFPPTSKKHAAVWSKLGAGACPDTEMWEVFQAKRVDVNADGTTTLVVFNRNPPNPNPPPEGEGLFGYTLRVTKDGGTTYLPLDPGGDNQNGQVRGFSWSYASIGILSGAAAGGAATLLNVAATATSALTSAAIGAVIGLLVALVVGSMGGGKSRSTNAST